jgi:hypothetical protein
MKDECGICEYRGEIASAPLFLCFNCADAIRRLVWIRERECRAAELPLAMSQIQRSAGQQTTANYES